MCPGLSHLRSQLYNYNLRLLHFALTKTTKKKCFRFNDRFYEQIPGTTMSTKCAPSYAITFMDKFERDFLSKYPLIPLIWWRYNDDIFMIWPYTREELYSFINGLNTCHPTLRFTQGKQNISGIFRRTYNQKQPWRTTNEPLQ